MSVKQYVTQFAKDFRRCNCGCGLGSLLEVLRKLTLEEGFQLLLQLRQRFPDRNDYAVRGTLSHATRIRFCELTENEETRLEVYAAFYGQVPEEVHEALEDEANRALLRDLLGRQPEASEAPLGRALLDWLLPTPEHVATGSPQNAQELACYLVETGVELGIFREHRDYLIKIVNAIYGCAIYSSIGLQRVFARLQHRLGRIIAQGEEVGPGLEVVPGFFGGELVYFNQTYLGLYTDITWHSANDDIAVWMTDETIDSGMDGRQWRLTLWAYRTGNDEPRQIFEAHAWSGREGNGHIDGLTIDGNTVRGTFRFTGIPATRTMAGTSNRTEEICVAL